MAKLKNLISQLSQEEYEQIYKILDDSNADKSTYLLKAMREGNMQESKVMQDLGINHNAYYTLRSRLNQRIEDFLLEQMESPRTDLLKKVANINETIFNKKRTISIATLKKLEKELLDYDLSNELTIVYKALKKLHSNTPEASIYSQLYNKHVAYMLATDKVEDLLVTYYKQLGIYAISGLETDKLSLIYINREMDNVCKLYNSHRLYVYRTCLKIFHRLYIEPQVPAEEEATEDLLSRTEEIFNQYTQDSIYHNLRLVLDFLKVEYYHYYGLFRKVEDHFEEVNINLTSLISNYTYYTFPSKFLYTKLARSVRRNDLKTLREENFTIFQDYEADHNDLSKHVHYTAYRALCCYYAEEYTEAAQWLNDFLNLVSMKKYPFAVLEIKVLLALQYCCSKDIELLNQSLSSIQRQIRLLGKENCEKINLLVKIIKIGLSEAKRDKHSKIKALINKLNSIENERLFTPIDYLSLDDNFIERICITPEKQ